MKNAYFFILLFLLSACTEKTEQGLDFKNLGCVSLANPFDTYGTKASVNGSVLRVDVFASVICNAQIGNPKYKISNDEIFLGYTIDVSELAAKCYCKNHSVFFIKDFKPNNVEPHVIFKETYKTAD